MLRAVAVVVVRPMKMKILQEILFVIILIVEFRRRVRRGVCGKEFYGFVRVLGSPQRVFVIVYEYQAS